MQSTNITSSSQGDILVRLFTMIESKNPNDVELLINQYSQVLNMTDSDGKTGLMNALETNNPDIARLIISYSTVF